MTRGYLALGKWLILLLAVGGPLILYQAFRNHRTLLEREVDIKVSLREERELLAGQIAYRYFNTPAFLNHSRLHRRLPEGPIQGLTGAPGPDYMSQALPFSRGETSTLPARLLALLRDSGRFPSGLPKRYAGLIEILALQEGALSPNDFQLLHRVMADFWQGAGIEEKAYAFLLSKLVPPWRALFFEQRLFVGEAPGQAVERKPVALVNLVVADTRYLLEVADKALVPLNQILTGLEQDLMFVKSSQWQTAENISENIRFTLETRAIPSQGAMRRVGWVYLSITAGLWLMLALIYGILTRYERINRAQKQLLATTSHELRTPLTVIRQFSEMLLDRGPQFSAKHHAYHQFIHRESLKMQFLVENLLSAARFEFLQFKPSATAIPLKQWVEEIVAMVSPLNPDRVIRQQVPELTVHWDAGLISQVLLNLLENARIHAGTDIDLKVVEENDDVVLEVRDYGERPQMRRIQRIKAFKTAANPKTGLGLGLYLCRRIVQAHGGSLSFEPAQPGLRVIIRLPPYTGAQQTV